MRPATKYHKRLIDFEKIVVIIEDNTKLGKVKFLSPAHSWTNVFHI